MTAVDILENKTEADAIALFDGFLTFREFMDNLNKYFEKAKKMEKQQIIDATYYGHLKGWVDDGVENSHGEQYYNETYNKE